MKQAADRLAVTVQEAADTVGLSRAALYPLIMRGEIPSFRVGKRRLVPMEALRRWMEEQIAAQTAE